MLQGKGLLASRASRIEDTCRELESPRIDRICFYERIVRLRYAKQIDLAENCLRERRWGHWGRWGHFPNVLLG